MKIEQVENTLRIQFYEHSFVALLEADVEGVNVSVGKNATTYSTRKVAFSDIFQAINWISGNVSELIAPDRKNQKIPQDIYKSYFYNKYKRLIGHCVKPLWDKILSELNDDQMWVYRVHKRYFSVNFVQPDLQTLSIWVDLLQILKDNPYLEKDFFNNPFCTRFFAEYDHFQDKVVQGEPHLDKDLRDKLHLKTFHAYQTKWGIRNDNLEAMLVNWRHFLSPDYQIYPTLNKLLAQKVKLPKQSLHTIFSVKHERTFGRLGWYVSAHLRNNQNVDLIYNATEKQIKKVRKEYQRLIDLGYVHESGKPNSLMRLYALVGYLLDYPEKHNGNIVGLMEATKEYHRRLAVERQASERERNARLAERNAYFNQYLAEDGYIRPEIEIEAEGFYPLRSDAQLREEGTLMGHCIGGYSAYKSSMYFWHVTYNGHEVSVAVDTQYLRAQIHGIQNRDNPGCDYARKVVQKWTEDMKLLRQDQKFLTLSVEAPF